LKQAIKGSGEAELIKKQIADTTKEIDDVIALMMEAAKSGSSAAVADSARQLDQLMKQKTKLVQSLKGLLLLSLIQHQSITQRMTLILFTKQKSKKTRR